MFFSYDAATTDIYTLSLHDALPICDRRAHEADRRALRGQDQADNRRRRAGSHPPRQALGHRARVAERSEEHTSELQSRRDLVCRLLLEKKKNTTSSESSAAPP